MTKEQMRIAIAEKVGWKSFPYVVINGRRYDKETWVSPVYVSNFNPDNPHGGCASGLNSMPDYPNDLNAMHEARSMCFSEANLMLKYVNALGRIVAPHWTSSHPLAQWVIVNATAWQHAESFCRVFWPERWEK